MLEAINLCKDYEAASGTFRALSDVSLTLADRTSASIVGPSGSGKSTLLYILGGLEPPTSGTVSLDGRNPFELKERDLAAFRNERVGFVFQDHHLLPQLSVIENVLVPTLVAREPDGDPAAWAASLIEQVGLGPRMHHRPHQLSGGEKQRAAVARALVRKPRLVLCDEPTGNLDHAATEVVASLLLHLHRQQGTILVVVSHNLDLARRFDRQFRLTDTRLECVPQSGPAGLGEH